MTREQEVLDEVSRIPGVRSVILVSRDDGIVVADASLDGQNPNAVAALSSRLAQRLGTLTQILDASPASVVLLQATAGQLFVVDGNAGLLLAALTSTDVNIGAMRLALLDAAGRLN